MDFEKKHCPYLTPCKISKTCHHTLYEVLVIRSLWFPSRYHSKLLNRYGLGNCTKQIGYLDVIAMFVIAYNKPRLRQSAWRAYSYTCSYYVGIGSITIGTPFPQPPLLHCIYSVLWSGGGVVIVERGCLWYYQVQHFVPWYIASTLHGRHSC